MYEKENKFGKEKVYDINQIKGSIYFRCCACMSVYTDALCWANKNKSRIKKKPQEADNIIVLGCQVTDLAILSDLRNIEYLKEQYKNKQYFIAGCLAQRFDIELDKDIKRLDIIEEKLQPINDRTLVEYAKPFWVKDFKESKEELADGNLFRNMYPLKIGVGCHGNCTYCTIKETRGKGYCNEAVKQEQEFLDNEDVVLISDSPSPKQIRDWCNLAIKHNKPISIRNIEPQCAVIVFEDIKNLAKSGLLKVFHCPIQSTNREVLKDMGRDVEKTMQLIGRLKELKEYGVILATNIIIDYKNFPNTNENMKIYDYISWNPLWDGKWNRKKAEERYEKYFENKKVILC